MGVGTTAQSERKEGLLGWFSSKWQSFKDWLSETWFVKTVWSWWTGLGNKKDTDERNGIGILQDVTGGAICFVPRLFCAIIRGTHLVFTDPKLAMETLGYKASKALKTLGFALGIRYIPCKYSLAEGGDGFRRDMDGVMWTMVAVWFGFIFSAVIAPYSIGWAIVAIVAPFVGAALVNSTHIKTFWEQYTFELHVMTKASQKLKADNAFRVAAARTSDELSEQAEAHRNDTESLEMNERIMRKGYVEALESLVERNAKIKELETQLSVNKTLALEGAE